MGIADHLHVIRQVFSLLRKLQLSVRFFIRLMYLLLIYGDALVCEVILRESGKLLRFRRGNEKHRERYKRFIRVFLNKNSSTYDQHTNKEWKFRG